MWTAPHSPLNSCSLSLSFTLSPSLSASLSASRYLSLSFPLSGHTCYVMFFSPPPPPTRSSGEHKPLKCSVGISVAIG